MAVSHKSIDKYVLKDRQRLASRLQWLRFSTRQCSRIISPS
jgi:hypothetical protein